MTLLKKIFDYFIWIMFFVLLILGAIIYVTNRTYPGDSLYPFKLKFEGAVLAASRILNKQVDVSIDLVMKRSNETTKTLTTQYAQASLDRLDTQVLLTADSISQIRNPVEKKQEAVKYIAKLSQVSTALTEKQNEFVAVPTSSNNSVPRVPQPVQNIPTQQINNTQQTIQNTIDEMTNITTQNELSPSPTPSPIPTSTPTPMPTLTPVPTKTVLMENNTLENNYKPLNLNSDHSDQSLSPSASGGAQN